jgi:hypothetical protein
MKGVVFGLALLSLVLAGLTHRSHVYLDSPAPNQLVSQEFRPTLPATHSRPPQGHKPAIEPSVIAELDAQTDLDRRSEALERIVGSVTDANLRGTLDSLAGKLSPAAAELHALLARRWAESDPSAAASWAAGLPESPARQTAFTQVAIAWADHNLGAAADWVQALPEGELKQTVTLTLGYEDARTDGLAALVLAAPLPATPRRTELLVHAIRQWAGEDHVEAAAWAAKVRDPLLRHNLIAAVAVAAAEQDGNAGAALAAKALPSGEEQDRTVVSVVQRWAQSSPEAAGSWVAEFPNTPSRAPAMQNLISLWTHQDPAAANSWLLELPDGSLREVGMAAHIETLGFFVEPAGLLPP